MQQQQYMSFHDLLGIGIVMPFAVLKGNIHHHFLLFQKHND